MNERGIGFFDSSGGLWFVCDPSSLGALAFGPGGAARAATIPELMELGLLDGDMTPLVVASNADRVDWPEEGHPEQWPVLVPGGARDRATAAARAAVAELDNPTPTERDRAWDDAWDRSIRSE